MSWSIHIETDKDITESDIDAVVAKMPEWMQSKFKGLMKGSKQKWGWSLAVDVHKPDQGSSSTPRSIWCGGSCSISGQVAEKFCREFAKMLSDHVGCKSSCTEMSI